MKLSTQNILKTLGMMTMLSLCVACNEAGNDVAGTETVMDPRDAVHEIVEGEEEAVVEGQGNQADVLDEDIVGIEQGSDNEDDEIFGGGNGIDDEWGVDEGEAHIDDIKRPKVLDYYAVSARVLEIVFDEAVDFESIVEHESIYLEGQSLSSRTGYSEVLGSLEQVNPSTIRFVAKAPLITTRDGDGNIIPWRYILWVRGADQRIPPVQDLAGNAFARSSGQVFYCNESPNGSPTIPCRVIGDDLERDELLEDAKDRFDHIEPIIIGGPVNN